MNKKMADRSLIVEFVKLTLMVIAVAFGIAAAAYSVAGVLMDAAALMR